MANYKLDREQVSKLNAGLTSNWSCQFDDVVGSSAPTSSSFNIIPGKFFPAVDIDYVRIKWISKEISVGPDIKIKRPVRVELPQTVSISFIDSEDKRMLKTMVEWSNSAKLLSANSKKPKEYSKKVHIWFHDNEDNLVVKDTLIIVPSEEYRNKIDYSFSLDTNVIQFDVIGYE